MKPGQELRVVPVSRKHYAASFSPNGRRLALALREGPISVLDAAMGQEVHTLRPPEDLICDLAFSADGRYLGLAHGRDALAGGVFQGMPFAVRLWSGPAGVGRFIYDDPVVGPSGGVDLAEGDHETVATGHIMIQSH